MISSYIVGMNVLTFFSVMNSDSFGWMSRPVKMHTSLSYCSRILLPDSFVKVSFEVYILRLILSLTVFLRGWGRGVGPGRHCSIWRVEMPRWFLSFCSDVGTACLWERVMPEV